MSKIVPMIKILPSSHYDLLLRACSFSWMIYAFTLITLPPVIFCKASGVAQKPLLVSLLLPKWW